MLRNIHWGVPNGSSGKESTYNAVGLIPGLGDPLQKDRLPTPAFLDFPGGSDGKESACNAGNLD